MQKNFDSYDERGQCFDLEEGYGRRHKKKKVEKKKTIKSFSSDIILKEIKKHLDDIISGELPQGEDKNSLSTVLATRALIETLEKNGVTVEICEHKRFISSDPGESYSAAICADCGERHFGWYCPKSPDGQCHYSKSFDCCDYCGYPEERK
jgi:hypothetical protein